MSEKHLFRQGIDEEMLVIGVTGGICSGKSLAVQILQDTYHLPVVNADRLGHESYLPGTTCYQQLIDAFGPEIVQPTDQLIDRKRLGQIVFSDGTAMNKLNAIVWPAIRMLLQQRLEGLRVEGHAIVVVEAAVMIEAGWQDLVDSLWVVITSESSAIDRLERRNQLSREAAIQRIKAQLSNAERIQRAQVVLENDLHSIDEFTQRVKEAFEQETVKLERSSHL